MDMTPSLCSVFAGIDQLAHYLSEGKKKTGLNIKLQNKQIFRN